MTSSERAGVPIAAASPPAEPILEARGLSKRFAGIRALDRVDFTLRRGEVHALLGENGAGKSTLMNVLAGMLPPDTGEIRYRGVRVRWPNPHAALRHGVAMMHQESMPFPALSVAENILMGNEPVFPWTGLIRRRQLEAQARAVLQRVGLDLSPHTRMGDLSVAEMQGVEIAKALAWRTEVLIMDEPTSALSDPEVERLFRIVRDLQDAGVAIVYVSHRLEEVLELADRVTVLRDGRWVATRDAAVLDRRQIIELMVGCTLAPGAPPAERSPSSVLLRVRGLRRAGGKHAVGFEVCRGEILGIAGLMGSGRSKMVQALYGLPPAEAGEIELDGTAVAIRCPRDAIAKGIALVTEDRRATGLVSALSINHNITLSSLDRFGRFGCIDRPSERTAVATIARQLAIKIDDGDAPVGHLSGGNQQKTVLAKALLTEPRLLLLDEPTRGIDVGAKAEIHALIRGLARAGKAVVLVSSDLPEVLALSDRLLVMREDRLVAELDPRRATQAEVLHWAMPPAETDPRTKPAVG